nr:immunoglobulin heavy chain junction region [Mus musculus]
CARLLGLRGAMDYW